jgi:tetratricopeptide (TPR) repeat protein
MDFGIARSLSGKGITAKGVMIGTPEYMSPEQVEGKDTDQRSDIYSLGIILYEMLTGRVPFVGDTPFTVGVKHKSETPDNPKKYNPRIPDDLRHIILKCLEKRPEDRFQSTSDICSELTRIEQGLPMTDRTALRPRPTTSKQITVSFTPKKLIIPALILAALLLVVFLIWKPWDRTPYIQSTDSGLPSIAFLKLRNGTGDTNLDHLCETIPDLLISDLDQSHYFRVQSVEAINQALRQMNLTDETTFTADELREIARRTGVKTLVTGNFSKFGDKFRINISLNNAEMGEVLSSERADGESENDVYELVDELTRKVKSSFNLTTEQLSSDQDKEIGVITTPYDEAYRLYRQGRELFARREWKASIPLMERAIEIDPNFAMAYRSIGSAYFNMGGNQDKGKEYLGKALEKSDRLSFKERRVIKAHYYYYVENDWQRAMSIWQELVEIYPEDNLINHSIAVQYADRRDFEYAIRHYEVCRKNRTEMKGTYDSLAYNYMALGEYEKAREAYWDYIDRFGDDAEIRFLLAVTYICEGRIDDAIPDAKKAIEMNPKQFTMGIIDHLKGNFEAAEKDYERWLKDNDARTQTIFRFWLACLNMTQGKYGKAQSYIQEGLALAKGENLLIFSNWLFYLKCYCDINIGRVDEALAEIQANEDLIDKIMDLAIKSYAYYHTRQPAKIRELAGIYMRELEENDAPDISDGLFYKGLADLTDEKYENAAEILNQAWQMQIGERSLGIFNEHHVRYLYLLGEAYRLNGNHEKARQTYERAINLTVGKLLFGDLWAKSHLRLGEVYEKLGNRAKAIEHTEKFLEMWKDADPGLPEVADARERVAKLKH